MDDDRDPARTYLVEAVLDGRQPEGMQLELED
jgi:hypothetical protein